VSKGTAMLILNWIGKDKVGGQLQTGVDKVKITVFDWTGPQNQGNCILIAWESSENLCQDVIIPARLEAFAAETTF